MTAAGTPAVPVPGPGPEPGEPTTAGTTACVTSAPFQAFGPPDVRHPARGVLSRGTLSHASALVAPGAVLPRPAPAVEEDAVHGFSTTTDPTAAHADRRPPAGSSVLVTGEPLRAVPRTRAAGRG